MKIKKFGHCCLLIEIDGLKILTDPGSFTMTTHAAVIGVDVILITHEHGDHLHIDSVKEIMKNNPSAKIYTNSGVGKQLEAAGITYSLLEGRAMEMVKGVSIEAFDCKHEEIWEELGQVQNTAYLIAGSNSNDTFLIPGDSFFAPEKPVAVLALPLAGPWCKLPDAIRYALRVKPKMTFPIHDGMIRKDTPIFANKVLQQVFEKVEIDLRAMGDGDETEF